MPVNQGQALNLTKMETILYVLSGLVATLGGLNIVQIFAFKAQKKKVYAEADQSQNTADAGKFDNMQKEINYMRELREQDRTEMQQIRKESVINADRVLVVEKENQQLKYNQTKQATQIAGIQRTLNKEVGRKKYAEHHICLNVDCQTRKPNLGEFHTEDPITQDQL